MRERRLLGFLAVLLGFWVASTARALAAVQVVAPNGGECLTVGQAYTVTVSFDTDHVALYYRTDGQQPTHLDASEIKHPLLQTTWSWTPTTADISLAGRIWVEGHNSNHNSANQWDSSNANFEVASSCGAPPPPPSSPASPGSQYVPPPPPVIQGNIAITDVTPHSAVITWRSDRYSYTKLVYGTSSANYSREFSIDPIHGFLEHRAVLSGLPPETPHYFQVITGAPLTAEKVTSTELSFVTLPLPDLIPPQPARNAAGIAGPESALLVWVNPSDPDYTETTIISRNDRYALHHHDGKAVFRGNENYYADSGLLDGVTYYYTIFTLDFTDNESEPVKIALTPQRTLPPLPAPPLAPDGRLEVATATLPRAGFPSSKPTDTAIALQWKNPQSKFFLGTHIVRNSDSLPANPQDGEVVFRGRAETFRDQNLKPERRYNYGIFAFDWSGAFSPGAFISDTTEPAPEAIALLQAQIKDLEKAVGELSLLVRPAPARRALVPGKILRLGSQGEEVRDLQRFLARYPQIYPEGRVTGYFGPLTREAVKRFQVAYGIVTSGDEETTGFGLVGPKTAERMNQLEKGVLGEQEVRNVTITAEGFSPKTLKVPRGGTVRWLNTDTKFSWVASDPHPTHTLYPGFDSLRGIHSGEIFSFTFRKSGRWGYHDHLNPQRVGEIVVE